MENKLKTNHTLFKRLKNEHPQWWKRLISEPDLYIDIRKDNSINVYHNGGSIMKLWGTREYIAEISVEYIPFKKDKNYSRFEFQDGNISFKKIEIFGINNFSKKALQRIKSRVKKFHPNDSEKGIQGQYVVKARNELKNPGFFIDTEIQYRSNRIDMVWVDLKSKKIAFVELKTISDARLYTDKNQNKKAIDNQIEGYFEFARKNKKKFN